jgi:hypothetical protein
MSVAWAALTVRPSLGPVSDRARPKVLLLCESLPTTSTAGATLHGLIDVARLARIIQASQADIVALNEVFHPLTFRPARRARRWTCWLRRWG